MKQTRFHPQYKTLTQSLIRAKIPHPGNTAGALLANFKDDGAPVLLKITSFVGRKVPEGQSFFNELTQQLVDTGYLVRVSMAGSGWERNQFLAGPKLHKYLRNEDSMHAELNEFFKDWEPVDGMWYPL